MKEIGAIFVVSISEIRTVQLAAIKRRYSICCAAFQINKIQNYQYVALASKLAVTFAMMTIKSGVHK